MNNKKVTLILTFFSILFLLLIGYLTTINIYYQDDYTESTYNQRNSAKEAKILRGTIYDRKGTVLAYSETEGNSQIRYYPYKNLYSHVIGYSSPQYGKSLIEKQYNQDLLGKNNISGFLGFNLFSEAYSKKGDDLTLTIDHNLQKKAASLMKRYTGALVAMNPKTGEILAMVSMPDFDPSPDYLSENWEKLTNSQSSTFLTRATMGLYPPGSTYKVITSSLILENGLELEMVSDTDGKIHLGDKDISNDGGKIYGETDLQKGFVKSSNVYYASMGSRIDKKLHDDVAKRFMFGEKTNFDFPYNKSKFETGSGELDRAISSIGQGKTLSTPLHLALVASAISNDGYMPKPYIVSKVSDDHKTIYKTTPTNISQPVSVSVAQSIKDLMYETVRSGTGTAAAISGIKVCGKTGTAENEKTNEDKSKTHATFVGFAPYDDPEIAVSVVLEYAGYGGSVAAPIAREVIREYLR